MARSLVQEEFDSLAKRKAHNRKHPRLPCVVCGEDFDYKPNRKEKYCSWKCFREESPHWLGDAVSERGARSRTQALIPSGECEVCGAENADRHHKDRNILNNHLDNIAYLCRSHHIQLHQEEDGRKKIVERSAGEV